MIQSLRFFWLALLILWTGVLAACQQALPLAVIGPAALATPALNSTVTATATLSAPAALQPETEGEQIPQVLLVLDVSRSMGSLALPHELSTDLAALRAQIEQIEADGEYVRLSQQLHTILANPDVEAGFEAWSEASSALDRWLAEKGYGASQLAITEQVATLLTEDKCDPGYDAFIAYASNPADLAAKLDTACPDVTLSETQQQALQKMVAYVEQPQYQALRASETKLFEAYTETRNALGYQEVREQFNTLRENREYDQLQTKLAETAAAEGIPTRLDQARLAALSLLDLSRLDTLASGREAPVGLVSFSNTATLLQPLTTDYSLVEAQLKTLQPLDQTNLGAGLETALAELAQHSQPNQPIALLLLSDGHANQGPAAEEMMSRISSQAQSLGLKVCAVGLGSAESDVDGEMLRRLAEAGNGQYLFASTAEELTAFFIACRQGLVSRLVDQFAGVARQNETVEAGQIAVRDDVGELTLTFNYLQGRLAIELVDAEGNIVDATYPGVTIENGQRVQLVKITNPRPGEWTVRVNAPVAPPEGVIYNVVVNTAPRPTPTSTPTSTPTLTPTVRPATATPAAAVALPATVIPAVTAPPTQAKQLQLYDYIGLGLLGLAFLLLLGGGIGLWVYWQRTRGA